MTIVIDEIRNTGAKQPIFVDLPCLYLGDQLTKIFKINREGVVWEAHRYVSSWTPTISDYENRLDVYVEKIVNDFGQPLFIGEYSLSPTERFHEVSDWRYILSQMVSKIDERQIVGRDFHKNELLEGEYNDYLYNYFTSSESDDIIEIILN